MRETRWGLYARQAVSVLVMARQLVWPRVLVTRQGVFFGRRGDWLCKVQDMRWIVEREMFVLLYEEADGEEGRVADSPVRREG